MNTNTTTFKWPPLESDPEIFTQYFQKLGLPDDISFNEIYSMDKEMLDMIESPVYAVILCCSTKDCPEITRDSNNYKEDNAVPYYMKQTEALDMACGVIASVHGVGNNLDSISLSFDSGLGKYFNEAIKMNSLDKAKFLENDNDFKVAHQIFANQGQSNLCNNADEVNNHYICFIYHDGKLYELDGLKKGPYLAKDGIKQNELLAESIEVIKKRIEGLNYTENFALMYLGKTG